MANVKDFCLSIIEAANLILEHDNQTPLHPDFVKIVQEIDTHVWGLVDEIEEAKAGAE